MEKMHREKLFSLSCNTTTRGHTIKFWCVCVCKTLWHLLRISSTSAAKWLLLTTWVLMHFIGDRVARTLPAESVLELKGKASLSPCPLSVSFPIWSQWCCAPAECVPQHSLLVKAMWYLCVSQGGARPSWYEGPMLGVVILATSSCDWASLLLGSG